MNETQTHNIHVCMNELIKNTYTHNQVNDSQINDACHGKFPSTTIIE